MTNRSRPSFVVLLCISAVPACVQALDSASTGTGDGGRDAGRIRGAGGRG
ncbi:MAG: hypothetical protein M3O50_09270 [Myxococcota bacterium]|nr:hypothetical protein [Myxococcota bacterium]